MKRTTDQRLTALELKFAILEATANLKDAQAAVAQRPNLKFLQTEVTRQQDLLKTLQAELQAL